MKRKYVIAAAAMALAILGAVCGVIHIVNAKADKADLEIRTIDPTEEPEEREEFFSTDADGIADKTESEAEFEADRETDIETAHEAELETEPEAEPETEPEAAPDIKAETGGEAEPEAMQEAAELPIDNFEDGTLNTVVVKTDEEGGTQESSKESGSSFEAGAKDTYGTYETERVPVR